MDSLSMVIGNLQALAGGIQLPSSEGDVPADGMSFGNILGGLVSAEKPDMGIADVMPEDISDVQTAEEDSTMLLSPRAENALKNLIAGYFGAKADGEISDEEIAEKLAEMINSLDGDTFSKLAAFSAELQTSLFGDGTDGEKSPKDVISELFEKYVPEKEEKEEVSDDIVLGAFASAYAALAAAVIPDSTKVVSEKAADGNVVEAAAEISAEQVRELISSADEADAEQFVQELSDAVEAVETEKAETAENQPQTEQNDNSGNPAEKEGNTGAEGMKAVIEKVSDNTDNTVKALAERFSYARPVLSEKTEADIPRIKLDFDTVKEVPEDGIAAMTEGTPVSAETAAAAEESGTPVFASEKEAADSVNFQTAEQIAGRIHESSDGETSEIIVRLNPRSLGQIAVKITRSAEGSVTVAMAAQSESVARLLDTHKSELALMLSERGSEVESVSVVEPSEAGHYLSFDMNGGQNPFLFGQGTHSRHGSAASRNEEDGEITDAVEEAAAENIYISQEARLWTTA